MRIRTLKINSYIREYYMRQYQVPQFITVEDKVIGPFSIKQFLYLAGGGAIIFFSRTLFTGYFFYFIVILVGSLAASLAFLKINEQSFPFFLKNAISYALHPRVYIWKKSAPQTPASSAKEAAEPEVLVKSIPKLSQSKLSDLAWSLNLKETEKLK